ncbi:hypothetical protein KP509_29G057900 [Ceratopteris richardii]|uniref:Uncharacterized protein n=1 Tax=Ceratopteris richardii TaxID=49495 RepID=A0A8T2R8Z7_CERRI|nr:hypothetical protein KP509_29G057900 [Ceratopteris richardii]
MFGESRLPCKKRHHPDGLHLSHSMPKRLLAIPEAAVDSFIDSVHEHISLPASNFIDASHESLGNSASSAVITSEHSTSMCVGHSALSAANVVNSKHTLGVTRSSQTPSDAVSFNPEYSNSARASPTYNGIWMYRSPDSRYEGTACASTSLSAREGAASASGCEWAFSDDGCSEVTDARTSVFPRNPEVVSAAGKPTHVISRREKSSLNPKKGMNEAWLQDEYLDYVLQKRMENKNPDHGKLQRKEHAYTSISHGSSSCASEDALIGTARSRQEVPHTIMPVYYREARGLPVGSGDHDTKEGLDFYDAQTHLESTAVCHSYPFNEEKMEEQSPAYVLSSGRLSLEEEARLGYRAPTIDRDFEEYFSALML